MRVSFSAESPGGSRPLLLSVASRLASPLLLVAVPLLLGGCRPRPSLGGSIGLRPAATAARPTPGLAAASTAPNAQAMALEANLDLRPYVADLVDNFLIRRWEKHIAALEPLEGFSEIYPTPSPTRKNGLDPIEIHFRTGEELFEVELSLVPGFGDAMGGKAPNMHRVHRGAHGGPDTSTCKSCHHRGGDDGAGEYTEAALTGGDGEHPDSANERNPPALHGGGALQILAHEITAVLHRQLRDAPISETGYFRLSYDGVVFGEIRKLPDGRIDTSHLRAIDPDLVIRPFGWKGTHSTLRRFAEEAFQVHHGLQSAALVQHRRIYGPIVKDASPATRAMMAALGDSSQEDPDGDQVRNELAGSQLTSMAVYLTLLPLPVIEPPRSPDLLAAWRDGQAAFAEVGCPDCHKPMWRIESPVWVERGEDSTSPVTLSLDLRKDIRNGPPLRSRDVLGTGYPLFPFTDLRRHDMGPELADRTPDGAGASPRPGPHAASGDHVGPEIPPSFFFTRPLWGLADSAPYLHDGRAATLDEAIQLHGGEATAARDAYRRLSKERQRALQVFLYSLARPTLPEVAP